MSRSQLVKEVQRMQAELDQISSDVNVKRGTSEIILPPNMSFDEAIEWLYRKKEEDETIVDLQYQIMCHPLDGALALLKAIKQRYGWSQMVPTPGFFGPTPPAMISMQIGPKESVLVPWGQMCIPGFEGKLSTDYQSVDGVPAFVIGANTKQKEKNKFYELAKLAQHFVEAESVYHRKALSMKLDWIREDRKFDPRIDGFKFLDLTNVKEDQLIFDGVTENILKATLFAFIENHQKCREMGIPLKRGILLEGPYGVGKTLTAYVTAKKAIDNGFTFILVEDARDLDRVIKMGRRYEPCVLFCEDIDRVLSGERDITIDSLLNTIDGLQSKSGEMILVLSSNNVENINKAMLRPGRLDAVIRLGPPTAEAVERLVKYYGGPLLNPTTNLVEVGKKLEGNIPATIREVVDRAKMISMIAGRVGHESINEEALRLSAVSMARQLELLRAPVSETSAMDKFAGVLGDKIGKALIQAHSEE
jgi:transitional endoplasmic reticulum ATPase